MANDTHYKYLLVFLVPVTLYAVIINWWGLKVSPYHIPFRRSDPKSYPARALRSSVTLRAMWVAGCAPVHCVFKSVLPTCSSKKPVNAD